MQQKKNRERAVDIWSIKEAPREEAFRSLDALSITRDIASNNRIETILRILRQEENFVESCIICFSFDVLYTRQTAEIVQVRTKRHNFNDD